jgi:putative oxidoreductase
MLGGGAPDDGMTKAERMHWFSKTASLNNSYFDNTTSLDYSLQLAFGIQNFKDWKATHIARSFPTKIADRLTAWTYPDTFITTILILLVLGFIIYKKPSWLVSDESLNNGRAILFIRIFIGIIMFYHGMPKILGGENTWMKLGLTMSNFGIYWRPLAWGYMASMTEALGGLLIVVGLAFRPAAFMLAVNLLVAAAKHIFAGQGLDTASHPLALAAIFIFLLVVGPGKKSLDFIIVNKKLNPTLS